MTATPSPRRNNFATLASLAPYLWPDDAGLRVRVIAALLCLIAAKLINVTTPMLFKRAIDALTPHATEMVVPLASVSTAGTNGSEVVTSG